MTGGLTLLKGDGSRDTILQIDIRPISQLLDELLIRQWTLEEARACFLQVFEINWNLF